MDGCDAMKSDPISKDQLADGLSALLGAATLNLDPTISVDLGMAQRLVDILRHSASGEPSEEQVRAFQDATRHALPIALVRTALQAAGIQSRQADAGAELRLGCLLATIHGDGGQYRQIHGTAKAVSDATRIVDAMRATTVSPTDDAIRSAVKLNSTPDRHCTVFKGTEITGYTLTDEGITELRKLFCGVPVGVTREFIETALRDYRLRNFVDEDNEPLALNDRLTNGPTVKEGNEEIHELADFIACRIADLSLRGEPEDWVNLAQMVADGNFNQADVIALARKLASQPGGE
jgi:hypothetical protein